jgi:toxin-antitoxin system PIN domain toxin
MTYLPDINVWIALAAEKHVHHRIARSWLAGSHGDQLVFCRITQMGFLRLLTNKHVMQEEVLSAAAAWDAYAAIRSDHRIGYMAEPVGLAETWNAFTTGGQSSPNLWTDAYLCAFAVAAGLTLLTFDAKMSSIKGLNRVVLG